MPPAFLMLTYSVCTTQNADYRLTDEETKLREDNYMIKATQIVN